MRPLIKLTFAAVFVAFAFAASGCNPLTGAYFMLFGVDDKIAPEFKIGSSGKNPNHVLILVTMIQESKSDLLGVERQMATAICKQLEAECKANKEKIKIVPVYKVEEFKTNNPGWRTMRATEIGRQFDVDFVIDVEVKNMYLYEKDSRKSLFHGRGAINLTVTDVAKSADEGPVHQRQITVEYPKAKGPIPADDDMSVERFRELFVQKIAQDVSWQLTAHVSTADLLKD
jgi:hypothetical protein